MSIYIHHKEYAQICSSPKSMAPLHLYAKISKKWKKKCNIYAASMKSAALQAWAWRRNERSQQGRCLQCSARATEKPSSPGKMSEGWSPASAA